MKSILLTAASLSIFAVGCGHALMQPKITPSDAVEAAAVDRPVDAIGFDAGEDPQAHKRRPIQLPGDFVVYRLTGSYRDGPVTMTQRVVARTAQVLVVDVTIDDGNAEQMLRLRLDETDAAQGEIISVAELDGTIQRPFGVARYEQLMNEIMLTADENLKMLSSTSVLIDVGPKELSCTKTSYQVRVGEDEAVMETLSSVRFPWGISGPATTNGTPTVCSYMFCFPRSPWLPTASP